MYFWTELTYYLVFLITPEIISIKFCFQNEAHLTQVLVMWNLYPKVAS